MRKKQVLEKWPRMMDFMKLGGPNEYKQKTLCMICDVIFPNYQDFWVHYQTHSDKETGN
jgi:hypothetical protein